MDLIISRLRRSSSDDDKRIALQELKEDKSKDVKFVCDFRKAGGAQPLVELLHSTDKKIAQQAISVFADCCREEGFQKEVRDLRSLDVPGDVVSLHLMLDCGIRTGVVHVHTVTQSRI